MNKPKNANSSKGPSLPVPAFRWAPALSLALALALAHTAAQSAAAHRLQDIALSSGPSQTALQLSFSRQAGEGDYPLYFQKADPSRGTLTLSFLETETDFPLGRHAVEPSNPLVEEVLLKRVTSPSGKNFLGIEVRLKEPPSAEASVQPMPRSAMKVVLGKGGAKSSWSLSKSLGSRDEYLNARAEPGPVKPAPAVPTAPAPPPEPASAAAGSSEGADGASGAAVSQGPAVLKEVRMAVTRSQEDVTLVFEPAGATPVHTAQANAKDSTILEIVLDGASSGLGRKEIALPRSGLFRKARVTQRGGSLVIGFHRLSGDPVHILPREGALTLTGAGKGEAAVPFKWSSLDPGAPLPALAAGGPDPVPSAHEDGAAVDRGKGGSGSGGQGLSSSKVFTLGKGGKGMILHKDSAALRESPSTKAKRGAKVPLGARVERLGREGAWLKVAYGPDSGYIRADQAVYDDEMTPAQAAALEKALAARAEALAAEQAAAAEREEAARKAERLAAEKAAQEAAAQAARAAEAAEPVRVAGPGMAAPSPKGAAGDKAGGKPAGDGPTLNLGGNPELADREAREKKAAEEERMRLEAAERRIAYNSYGRRDPFIPVEQGLAENGIDIDQMKVVGIIWQAQEPLAVLEHNKESGVSFTVKQGDPVHNGRVSRITRDQVTFDISEYGISRSYSLKLVSNKEGIKK